MRHLKFTPRQQNVDISSEESRFTHIFADRRVKYSDEGANVMPCVMRKMIRFGEVALWFRVHSFPYHGPRLIFQHDNAAPRVARLARVGLQIAGVDVLRWPIPSQSHRTRHDCVKPQTLQELEPGLMN